MRGAALGAAALALVAACTATRAEAPLPVDAPAGASTGAPAAGTAGDTATVRQVLELPALVGRTVHVRGRCLGYAVARAAGPPPRTRSDWQLEADGAAVWVTGPRPAGCTTAEGSTRDDVVTARVAQDTIPDLVGGGAGRARRFLVVGAE